MLTEVIIAFCVLLVFCCFAELISLMAGEPIRLRTNLVMFPVSALFCMNVIIELLVDEEDGLVLLNNINSVLFTIIFTSFIMFIMEFTKFCDPYKPSTLLLLSFVPAISSITVLTDPWFHLFNQSTRLLEHPYLSSPVLTVTPGLFSIVWSVYALSMGLFFGYTIVRYLFRIGERKVAWTFLLGILSAYAAISSSFFIDIIYSVTIDGLSFTLVLLVGFSISNRYGLFHLVPIGRHKMLDVTQDCVVVLDFNGNIEDMNQVCRDYLGKEADQVVGTPFSSAFSSLPALVDKVGSMTSSDKVGEITDAAGRTFEVAVNIFEYGRSSKSGKMAIMHDVTERKLREEMYRQANKQLNILNSITRHDMMNQLTIAQNYLDLMRASEKTDVQGERLDKMGRSIFSIQQQLEFTRLYQEIGVRKPEWQNVHGLVGKAQSMINLDGMGLSEEGTDILVLADPMLQKVVYNLIENTKRHGEGAKHITISVFQRGPDIVLTFADDGVGISAADRAHLFEQGYGKNTGFGLFLTREILNITGLSIREASEAGQGARFEITVPAGMFRRTAS